MLKNEKRAARDGAARSGEEEKRLSAF